MSKHSRKVQQRIWGANDFDVHSPEVAVFGWRVVQILRRIHEHAETDLNFEDAYCEIDNLAESIGLLGERDD